MYWKNIFTQPKKTKKFLKKCLEYSSEMLAVYVIHGREVFTYLKKCRHSYMISTRSQIYERLTQYMLQ